MQTAYTPEAAESLSLVQALHEETAEKEKSAMQSTMKMVLQKKYTKIYTAYDDYGYLHLLLYNDINTNALFFDGLKFTYKPSLTNIPFNYKQLNHPADKSSNTIYEIESIRQSGDLNLIKFKNGDVFQLYFMMDDNMSSQQLSIFERERDSRISTPLGMSLYDGMLKTFSEAEECEIETEE